MEKKNEKIDSKPKEETKEKKIEEHPDDKISRANAAAERMEAANKKHEALLNREEAQKVSDVLGGEAEAGIQNKEETEEEKITAAAKKQLEGTGFEDMV